MKTLFRFTLFVALVCLLNLSLNNFCNGGVSDHDDLHTMKDVIDSLLNCSEIDSNCLDISWGGPAMDDSRAKTADSLMKDLMNRSDLNIASIDSLTIRMTTAKRTIDSLKNSNLPVSSTLFNEFYNSKQQRNAELTISRKLDLLIRKIEYYFDLVTLHNVVRRPL